MRKLNVFFDVDGVLIKSGGEGELRNYAREVFHRLHQAGHSIYIWSGYGNRQFDLQKLGLDEFVTAYFTKPLRDYRAKLSETGVTVMPDFVVDDNPRSVQEFGGYLMTRLHRRQNTAQRLENDSLRARRWGTKLEEKHLEDIDDNDRELLNALDAVEAAAADRVAS